MSETGSVVTNGANPAAPKRSLFNKPSWSKPLSATVDTSDLFDRTNLNYAKASSELELKQKRIAARKATEKARSETSPKRNEKRRRLSKEHGSEEDVEGSFEIRSTTHEDKQGPGTSRDTPRSAKSTTPPVALSSPRSLTKRYEESVISTKREGPQSIACNVIDLEGDSSDQFQNESEEKVQVTSFEKPKPSIYEDDLVSDEEFPELARKAREKARRRRLEADSALSPTTGLPVTLPDNASHYQSQSNQEPTPPPPQPDPIVSLLITSDIPDTNALIVNRKLSQRLREVRNAWCNKQQFTAETAQTVVLTFRGKRLYDYTSCKGLGIGVDTDGNIVMRGEKDVFGETNRQIHVEAMTEEMLKEQIQAKERNERRKSQLDESNELDEPLVQQPKPEKQIKIILKATNYPDFKLIVKPVSLSLTLFKSFMLIPSRLR